MSNKINIASITVSRSDFGRMLPLYLLLQNDPDINFTLLITGSHFNENFSCTEEIQKAGINSVLEYPITSLHNPGYVCEEICRATRQVIQKNDPDYFLILGDRYEMLSATQVAVMAKVPVIHIGGGYKTGGAIDDDIRKAISCLATYHCTASSHCSEAVKGLGVEDESIFLTGAPDLDLIKEIPSISYMNFCSKYHLNSDKKFILCTVHPETKTNMEIFERNISSLEKFLLSRNEQIIITSPCHDPGHEFILDLIKKLQMTSDKIEHIPSLGFEGFIQALHHCSYFIGNSSAGIIEAASIPTAVINIGTRQEGRVSAENVLHSDWELKELSANADKIATKTFQTKLKKTVNPYGSGECCQMIYELIKNSFKEAV